MLPRFCAWCKRRMIATPEEPCQPVGDPVPHSAMKGGSHGLCRECLGRRPGPGRRSDEGSTTSASDDGSTTSTDDGITFTRAKLWDEVTIEYPPGTNQGRTGVAAGPAGR